MEKDSCKIVPENFEAGHEKSWVAVISFIIFVLKATRGHSKSTFVEEGGNHWKANSNEQEEGRSWHVCTFAFLKKNTEIFKWSFIVIPQFLLLIIMSVWNIKHTIMKDYNIQSCQWMACDRFCQPFLLCTTFFVLFSALSIIFFAHFQQKWLLIHWL